MCACDFWYRLSPRCSEPIVLAIIAGTVGGVLALGALALLWKHYGRLLTSVRWKAELNEELLADTQRSLTMLNEVGCLPGCLVYARVSDL